MNNGYHIEDLRTYLRCPQQYLYSRHYVLRYARTVGGAAVYYGALRQVINWFFVVSQDTPIGWSNLAKHWETFWANTAGNLDVNEAHTYLEEGLLSLNQFFWGLADELDIVLVDARLEIELGIENPLTLYVDIFALLRGRVTKGESFDGEFTVVILRNPVDPLPSLERDCVLDRLLLRTIRDQIYAFDKDSRLRVSILNLQSGCWSHRDLQSNVGDVSLLESLKRGIEAKCFYPRRGNHCSTCPFDSICHVDACSSTMLNDPDKANAYLRKCMKSGTKGDLYGFEKYRRDNSVNSVPGLPRDSDGILRINPNTGRRQLGSNLKPRPS